MLRLASVHINSKQSDSTEFRYPGYGWQRHGTSTTFVRRRVPELAQAILDAMGKVTINQEAAQNVAALIRKRCATILKRLTG